MTDKLIKLFTPLCILLSLASCNRQISLRSYYGHYKNDFIDFENKRSVTCGGTITLDEITYTFEMYGDQKYYFYFYTPARDGQFCIDESNLIWKFYAYEKDSLIELDIIKDFVSDYTGKKVTLNCIEDYRIKA